MAWTRFHKEAQNHEECDLSSSNGLNPSILSLCLRTNLKINCSRQLLQWNYFWSRTCITENMAAKYTQSHYKEVHVLKQTWQKKSSRHPLQWSFFCSRTCIMESMAAKPLQIPSFSKTWLLKLPRNFSVKHCTSQSINSLLGSFLKRRVVLTLIYSPHLLESFLGAQVVRTRVKYKWLL